MIQLIYGKKGTGKTKRLIAMANENIDTTNGNVAFLDDDNRYMYDIKPQVRFINVSEYDINNTDKLLGFLSGMAAQDYDLDAIYIDAFAKIAGIAGAPSDELIREIEKISDKNSVKVVINVSADPEEASDYLKAFII